MITKILAIQELNKYIGHDLATYAKQFGIKTIFNGKQNKGWKGLTLEKMIGLSSNNKQAPNGLGFELKSTAYIMKNNAFIPKETMAITMINSEKLINTPFYESHCWDKLKSIIFCAVSWYGRNVEKSELLKVTSFDFLEDDKLINEIKGDYEFIRNQCHENGFSSLTGRDGKWIQARTKGAGHGSKTRAFYARKVLLNEIFKF